MWGIHEPSTSLLTSVIGLTYAGAATADPPKIKGSYAAVGNLACLIAPEGFNANLQAINPAAAYSSTADTEGVYYYDGNGNGTSSGTNVSINPPPTPGFDPDASSNTFASTFTYTVNSDGTFTQTSTDTHGTVLTGPRKGQTFTVDLVQGTGLIGKDARSLTDATTRPHVETITYSNGNAFTRICYRQRVLIKMDDGE
jgi:hypothetical protein